MAAADTLELISAPHEGGGHADLAALLELHHPAAFMFRLSGNSSTVPGLLPGDFIVVRRDVEPQRGDLLAVYCRKCYQLMPFIYDNDHKLEQSKVFGVVIGAFRGGKRPNKALKATARAPDKDYNEIKK